MPGRAALIGARPLRPGEDHAALPGISYDDALAKLAEIRARTGDPELKAQLEIAWGDDFGSPHETELTQLFDKPVFVYGYPTVAKAFYMEPWPGRPEVCKSVDLLAPEGYGEIIGGSERISDPDLLLERIHEHNLPEEAFRWYMDLRAGSTVSPTVASGWASSAPSPGSAASTTSARPSPFPGLNRVYP